MPIHRIYTGPGLYSAADKQAFAKAITSYYHDKVGLPKFYVIILFHELPSDSFFIGDQAYDERTSVVGAPFVRIMSQHIARASHGKEARQRMTDNLEQVFKPFIADRGYAWEFNIEESEGDVARNGGFPLPAPGSEAEKRWKQNDMPSAYSGATLSDHIEQRQQQQQQQQQ